MSRSRYRDRLVAAVTATRSELIGAPIRPYEKIDAPSRYHRQAGTVMLAGDLQAGWE
jgi:hypothetical protein